jgi:hypothetical protein
MPKKWLLLLFISLFVPKFAEAQTINAASCNASDVQAAFNAVTSTTTTVTIPAGTCNWTGQVYLNVPSGNTALSVLGAGNLSTTGGGDATVIVDNDTNDSNYLLQLNTGTSSSFFRLAGLTLEGGSGSVKTNGILAVTGLSHSFRIDHFHLNSSTYSTASNPGQNAVIRLSNWIYGVMDHSIIEDSAAIEVWMDEYNINGNDGAGYASWADNSNFGTGNAFFMENNIFNDNQGKQSQFMDDCYAGGRFVIRYNTMNSDDVQTHPTGGAGQLRGCRTEEIYENTFNGSNSTPTTNVFWDSSGTALVWGNSAPAGYINFINLHSMRVSNSTYPQTGPPNGWGYCGTAFNGTGSSWDQNTNSATGYKCLDEPGTGKSDLLQNWFPTTCDVTSGGCASKSYNGTWPNQALEPIYEWLNSWTPVPGYPGAEVNNSNAPALSANVDWYQYASSFNGTSGIGSGVLSAMPSSCTKGVAYWATDQGNWNQSGGSQGQLYVCSPTGQWTLYYVPYTYPHPLTGSGSTTASAPAAPTALKAVVQ